MYRVRPSIPPNATFAAYAGTAIVPHNVPSGAWVKPGDAAPWTGKDLKFSPAWQWVRIGAFEPVWSEPFGNGKLAADNPRAQEFIEGYVARRRPGLAAQRHLQVVINPDSSAGARERGYDSLERLDGDRRNGREVFRRVSAVCHRVEGSGDEFGPDMTDVGKRLSRRELIESIIEPSKKLEAKYITSTVITAAASK